MAYSFTEAEYRVIASTATELTLISSLLRELSVQHSSPTIYYDNMSVTYPCVNPIFHSPMKHIVIDFHFVRDKVIVSDLKVSHILTHD